MDDELSRTLYRFLFNDPLLLKPPRRGRHCDAVILLIYCLSCATHLSVLRLTTGLSCWPLWMRRLIRLPSDSTVSRRMSSPQIQQHMQRLHGKLLALLPGDCNLKVVDGLPMTVGGFSHDPDAKRGHVPGGAARGCKLHNLVNPHGVIEAFTVTPLNALPANASTAGAKKTSGKGSPGR